MSHSAADPIISLQMFIVGQFIEWPSIRKSGRREETRRDVSKQRRLTDFLGIPQWLRVLTDGSHMSQGMEDSFCVAMRFRDSLKNWWTSVFQLRSPHGKLSTKIGQKHLHYVAYGSVYSF